MSNRIKLINAIDTLADAEHLVEATLMAAQALTRQEGDAMQAVIMAAQRKIEKCKALLYVIHEGGKGGDA
ncbi:hypothetical protein GRZ55_11705 [Chelativorans sp. ZYF759]|uniref:hypothetical protein n=1 Tax=Chelativorans sp. ZYF759 TaxID=2692213 RepID=UPI00145CC35A|nr:hypothetical protein [Chelativorans sp. ZYF759]NMG39909.1 hypothetical protein [Chelativorans sp. ZYF759]